MRLCLILAIVLAGCVRAQAPEALPAGPTSLAPPEPEREPMREGLSEDSRIDAERVASATFFALGGVGVTGDPTPEYEALVAIAGRDDAVPALLWLAVHASPAGQLLALVALQELAPEQAAPHLDHLRADERTVYYLSGCIGTQSTVGEIVADIAAGTLCAGTCLSR